MASDKVQMTFEGLLTMAERAPTLSSYGERVEWIVDTILTLDDREAFVMLMDVRDRLREGAAHSPEREPAHKAIDEMGELPVGWDSYGAPPPSPMIVKCAHRVVDVLKTFRRVAPYAGGIVVHVNDELTIWCEEHEGSDEDARAGLATRTETEPHCCCLDHGGVEGGCTNCQIHGEP